MMHTKEGVVLKDDFCKGTFCPANVLEFLSTSRGMCTSMIHLDLDFQKVSDKGP